MKVEIRRTAAFNGDIETAEQFEKLIYKYDKQIEQVELQLQQINQK
ncbi:TPA: hypothetical protein ROY05_005314 [Bacillus toyonensis]|nr:hypothetical protein [Bacillus toyonensis]